MSTFWLYTDRDIHEELLTGGITVAEYGAYHVGGLVMHEFHTYRIDDDPDDEAWVWCRIKWPEFVSRKSPEQKAQKLNDRLLDVYGGATPRYEQVRKQLGLAAAIRQYLKPGNR